MRRTAFVIEGRGVRFQRLTEGETTVAEVRVSGEFNAEIF